MMTAGEGHPSRAGRSVVADNDQPDFETTERIEPIMSFDKMGLKEDLLRGIYQYGLQEPSAIQQRAVMPIVNGRDVIVQGQSGTDKASMIALTVCQMVDTSSKEVQALILSPTRELALQTEKMILLIGGFMNIQARSCLEDENVGEDIKKQDHGLQVVSGTPDGLFDMIKRQMLCTRFIKLLVMDESDEMLSRGFKDQIYELCRYLPPNLQIVLISATLPLEILDMSGKFMRDPVRILMKHKELTLEKQTPSRRPGADDFGRAVSRAAVAQICENLGYDGFSSPALEILADVAIRYIRDMGKTASFYANLAGRTQCNLFDIIESFEDLDGVQGLLTMSGAENCLVGSSKVREMIDFMASSKEMSFAQPVPRYPVIRSWRMIPSFAQMGETPPGKHIPAWLPAFPDPHTYKHTPMWNQRTSDPRADKIEQARQRRKAERALLSLQQRLVCKVSNESSTWGALEDGKEESQESGNEQFHSAPLQLGENNVAPFLLPAKGADDAVNGNTLSVLEAFAPAIEAVKVGFCDEGDGDRKFLPDKRPAIHFKLRTGKKHLGEYLNLNLQKKGEGRAVAFVRDEERDDKKRRAEFILRQCMENPLDLNQL